MAPHKTSENEQGDLKLHGTPYVFKPQPSYTHRKMRVICIGAGASGIYMAIRQEQVLDNVDFQIYEKNSDVGGTWRENKYPGAACDVPGHIYTYSFEPKTDWTHYYAGSDEIENYFQGVADKYRVQRFIKFEHRVIAACWNEKKKKYEVNIETAEGAILDDECDVLVNASGLLNAWKWPQIPGLEDFKGDLLHSANFDPKWKPDGRNIALIGNGSSAIQILPQVQPTANRVDNYIRSPTWISVPYANSKSTEPNKNPTYTKEDREKFANDPEHHLEYRCAIESEFNAFFDSFFSGGEKQAAMVVDLRKQMKQKLAKKPQLIERLIPTFGVGCRRLTPGIGYLETLTEENVNVVMDNIVKFTEEGILTIDDTERKVDTIICATGFDVSFKPRFLLTGKNGYVCDKKFAADPRSYLALSLAHLPNYFVFFGPQVPAANGSFIPVMESIGDYIISCIQKMRIQDILSMVPKQDCINELITHGEAFLPTTVFTHNCRSWYKNGTTDGRVTAIWPGSSLHYMEVLANPRWEDFDYEYENPKSRFSFLGNGATREESSGGDRAAHLRKRLHLIDAWWSEHVKTLDAQIA